MRRDITTPFIALALLLGATTAANAAGAIQEDRVSTVVRVADLNLQSRAGAQVALQRLRQAARAICGDEPSRDLKQQALFEACVRGAVNATVATSRSPVLAAVNGTPLAERMASAN